MNLQQISLWALFIVAGSLVLLSAAVATRKVTRDHRQRRRDAELTLVRPRLLELLDDESPDPALDQLGRGVGATLDGLAREMLSKLRGEDRAALVRLLDRRGILQRARRELRSASSVRRAHAAELLGQAGDDHATEDVVALLDDRDPDVRAVAARALGKLGDPEAVRPLLAAVDAARPVPVTIVTMALLHLGGAACGPLIDALSSDSARAHAIAAELLGLHGAFQAMPALLERLEDDVKEVRTAAAHGLGRLGAPAARDGLTERVRHDDSLEVRVAAAWALGEVGGEEALAGLRLGLLSDQPALVRTAAAGLGHCGESGERVLRIAAAQSEPWAGHAREALSRVALRDDHRVRSRKIAA
jgi:HEAT repeat protein